MIMLAERRQAPASRHMAARIEEINDRLRVVEFAIQELTMEGTVEAAEDALQATRELLAAVQEYWCVEQCSDGSADVRQHGSPADWEPSFPLDFRPLYELKPADFTRIINGLVNLMVGCTILRQRSDLLYLVYAILLDYDPEVAELVRQARQLEPGCLAKP